MAAPVNVSHTLDELSRLGYLSHVLLAAWPLTPLRIALIYTVFGFLALFASDVLMVWYVPEPLLSQLQAVKGAGEVIVTAGLIFVLSRSYHAQLGGVTEQIDRQREELEVLHRVLRHNLRNNLNQILGYAELIHNRNGFHAECESILSAVDRLARYTEQARRINRVTRGNGRVTFDLSDLIPGLLHEHDHVTHAVRVDVAVPDAATVEANHMFPAALEELVANAITHNDSAPPCVTIQVDDYAPLMTEIRIEDNGPGIPDSEIEPLRERREDPLSHPSGMGLWFVDWTVEHSNGAFTIQRNDAGGTVAHIKVPTAQDGIEAITAGNLWRI